MTERATDQETAILSNHLTHLLGAAQAHPDLEASEEELHHLVVLQVHLFGVGRDDWRLGSGG